MLNFYSFHPVRNPMPTEELIRQLRELRMLVGELHGDTRGNGHGLCTCQPTGPVCPIHKQVRQHLLNATNSLRNAIMSLNESSMTSSK